MNFGKDISLTWNTLKCGGVWLRLCYPSLKKENLVLEHMIMCLLDMLAIVHVIDFQLSRVIFLESYTIIEYENVIFFEHLFHLKNKEKLLHESIDTSNDLVNDVQELRRSKRARKEKSYDNDFLAYIVEDEHVSYYDAIKSIDTPFWLEAINSELDSIMSNHTQELVELPPKVMPIGCKWIFKRKLKSDDTIDKYKVHLVAKGYKQKHNVDFFILILQLLELHL